MRAGRAAVAGALLAVALAPGARAEAPADMVALARKGAAEAPNRLGRHILGQTAIPNYGQVQFRSVRANYKRQELVNDRIVFCGEMKPVADGKEWVKFAYTPDDPPLLASPTPGIGMREVGPPVFKSLCETGKEAWLDGDFSADFQRAPSAQN